ncbi:HAD family hydrolase [Aneurinibacillus sp. UBA3580]|jgi:putative hydrolase of the HAD superfamily|uniref:HAD family hydrolase n=1 Tax=Aneurinibacillus sp. UBA3580 TaxID=1946041 RepID=UPI00257DC0D8|nr:HAD family hydrolase [Aneurinibacillus sp. UBA3580]
MRKDIQGYIFDLDDTLYCEHEYVRSGFRAVAHWLSEFHDVKAYEAIYRSMIDEWERNGRGRIFDEVCRRFNIEAEIAKAVEAYRQHEPVLALYEDAERLLSLLEREEKKVGIITDGAREVQWRKIRALGLDKRVSCIIVSDDLGRECWKPSEIPYRKAVECLGLSYEKCVYIGDNPHKDFCTARKLGMHTIRIIRPIGDHMQTILEDWQEADRIIYSLDELAEEMNSRV